MRSGPVVAAVAVAAVPGEVVVAVAEETLGVAAAVAAVPGVVAAEDRLAPAVTSDPPMAAPTASSASVGRPRPIGPRRSLTATAPASFGAVWIRSRVPAVAVARGESVSTALPSTREIHRRSRRTCPSPDCETRIPCM